MLLTSFNSLELLFSGTIICLLQYMHLCKKHSSVIYNSFIKGIGSLACRLCPCSSGARAGVTCGRGLRQAAAGSGPRGRDLCAYGRGLGQRRPAVQSTGGGIPDKSQTIDATYNGAR